MRSDGKTNAQTATELEISKLSVVKNPAHSDALAAIIKTAFIDDENLFKQSFAEALQGIQLEEQIDQFMNSIWDHTWALRKSIRETIRDQQITNKKEILTRNISDFATALGGLVSNTNVIKSGGQDMKKEEVKALLKKAVDPLTKKLADAEAVLKMDLDTRVHFDALDKEGQENFLKMTTKDQVDVISKKKEKTEAIKKAESADETAVVNGHTIVKSVVGESVFQILKSQQKQIDTGETNLKKERETRELIEFTKQAEGMYPNLPGDASEKGEVMKILTGLTKSVRETIMSMFKAGNEGIELSKSFTEIGTSLTGGSDSPIAQLNKMAEDKAANDKIDFTKAYDEIMKTPEGAALYEKTLTK